MKILLVEDEEKLSNLVKAFLEKEGYEVIQSYDGKDALDKFRKDEFDFIILDLMLPFVTGESVCRSIRETSSTPIIMVTAKDEEEDVLEGLEIGADDYITKPFSVKELIQRIKVISRRINKPKTEKVFRIKDVSIDIEKGIVKKSDKRVDITGVELKILEVFIKNSEIILSREKIIEEGFGYEFEGTDRVIDAHIKNIRKKLEDNPKKPEIIKTIYGLGYKMDGK